MKYLILIPVFFSLVLTSCSGDNVSIDSTKNDSTKAIDYSLEESNQLESNVDISKTDEDTIKERLEDINQIESSYCYVKEIVLENNKTYIKVDFVTIENASSSAGTYIDMDGNEAYEVDEYQAVVNQNGLIRTFQVENDFVILDDMREEAYNLDELKTDIQNNLEQLFYIETKDKMVVKLETTILVD